MFSHILVPTDLTEKSLKAFEIAVKLSAENVCKVTLLHVVETIEDTDTEDFRKFYRQLGTKAEKKMDAIIRALPEGAAAVEKMVLFGRRVAQIIDFAAKNEIDLIIMSSHKLDVDNISQGWGTISFKTAVLSSCPVMLVK